MRGALLSLVFALAPAEASARWRCEPEAVELGEPFALVLELEHEAGLSVRALLPEASALEAALAGGWVVLGAEPCASAEQPGGRVVTRAAWRVAALEPGERSLAEPLAGVPLGEGVARIQVGEARVRVAGLLADGEDAPRPLRGFPPGFARTVEGPSASPFGPWLAAGLALAFGLAGLVLWRRRRRPPVPAPTALERLGALEAAAGQPAGERCYALTRLLREAGDALTRTPRPALTDEEWLAAVHASFEIPRGIVAELEAVFARAARAKYAGETPTEWALQETFARARGALQALQPGGTRP